MNARTYTFAEAAWAAIFLGCLGFALGITFMHRMAQHEAARRAAEPKLTPMHTEPRRGEFFSQWTCEPRQRAEYMEACKQRLRSGATKALTAR